MSAPPLPNDVQMVEPDPSLPKDLAGFWGKWEGRDAVMSLFIIVEKIDEEKASLYIWRSGYKNVIPGGWKRIEATVTPEGIFKNREEYGKYELWFHDIGNFYLSLKGEYLDMTTPAGPVELSRVP
jgi:hypothetical protein